MTEAAEAAKAIKKELQRHWPKIKFSVKSEYYSMGNSVNVSWTYGPTERQVRKIIDKYQHGSFDGMTDSYNYRKTTTAHSAKYVSGSRNIPYEVSEQIQKDYAAALGVEWNGHQTRWGDSYIQELTWRLLSSFELPADGYKGLTHVPEGTETGGHIEDYYEVIGGKRIDRYA